MSARIKTAVLISGRGSNMSTLIAAATATNYPAEICLVVSNRPDAKGLETAANHGIKTLAIDHKEFSDRQTFEQEMQKTLNDNDIELVVLAGFMRVLTDWFMRQWEGKMINIHPSLLPKYRGLNTYARAIKAGDREAGCTVHYVTAELDSGPSILQARVPILDGDTPDSLAARVLRQEHIIFPKALAIVANKLQV